ncbi:MAG: IclR family transcriptional regulator [Pseudomonadota bacterium]
MDRVSSIATRASEKSSESGSLARGLQVMGVLHTAMRSMGISEIAEETGLASSTVHRLLQTLVEHGQVTRTPASRYRPSARSLLPLLLDHPVSALRRDSSELLRTLCTRYGPSTSLILFFGHERALIELALGRYSVTPYYDTHLSNPYHATVSGKLLLSGLAPMERALLLGDQPLRAPTPNTVVDREALEHELALVQAEGYATNTHENVVGISAVGARLMSPSQRNIGAIVMSGPSEYFGAEAQAGMKRDLMQTADLLNSTSSALRAVARYLTE